ncbi:MAG: hypothetical protein P4L41_13495 [Flavipsychrobacter sp.]|nr:hypothetical protein [Flavipsychrobacter sp.]
MKEIKLYNSIAKPAKRVVLFLVLLAACFYVQHYFAISWPLWVGCILFGFPALFNLYIILDRRAQIVLSKEGIYDGRVHNGTIGWHVIKEAYALSVYGRQYICLAVDDNFKPANGNGNIYKRMALFTKSLGAKELNLSLTQMDVDTEKLAAFIVEMKTANAIERDRLLSAAPSFVE